MEDELGSFFAEINEIEATATVSNDHDPQESVEEAPKVISAVVSSAPAIKYNSVENSSTITATTSNHPVYTYDPAQYAASETAVNSLTSILQTATTSSSSSSTAINLNNIPKSNKKHVRKAADEVIHTLV